MDSLAAQKELPSQRFFSTFGLIARSPPNLVPNLREPGTSLAIWIKPRQLDGM